MNYIFEDFKKLDTIVMGVGIPQSGGSTLIQAGYLTKEEMDQYVEQGVAGDIALQFFDKEGNAEPFQQFNERVAGMTFPMMKGAIRGGYVNMLITNNECAEKLL